MQKILVFILFLIFSCPQFSAVSTPSKESEKVVYVYISTAKSAKCYHASRKCQSLRKSREIIKVKLSEVQKSRKACRHCYTPSSPLPARDYLDEPER